MFGGISRSETAADGPGHALAGVRVVGGVRARFAARSGRTAVTDLSERGGYRLAMPSTFTAHAEATLVNTGGGVAGGDRVAIDIAVGEGADTVFSTGSAERIYRSAGAAATVDISLSLAPGARLDWLPHQTILYAGSRARRRIDVAADPSSRLTMMETLTIGRAASRETAAPVDATDNWRIRRGGRLIFAESLRLAGDPAELLRRPTIAGARTVAILLHVAPNAEDRLDAVRGALTDAPCAAAASAWGGLLTVRFLHERADAVMAAGRRVVEVLSGRPLPRVWNI